MWGLLRAFKGSLSYCYYEWISIISQVTKVLFTLISNSLHTVSSQCSLGTSATASLSSFLPRDEKSKVYHMYNIKASSFKWAQLRWNVNKVLSDSSKHRWAAAVWMSEILSLHQKWFSVLFPQHQGGQTRGGQDGTMTARFEDEWVSGWVQNLPVDPS